MRLVDRLILKELAAPWAFGVGLFTALLVAGTYLGRIAGYLVDGAPGGIILQLTLLLVPAIMVKTFSMAVLLAALLAFGRLSSDSEIVALRAGGASVLRIVRPVMVFSLFIAAATFAFNETVVPRAAVRSTELARELVRSLKPGAANPVAYAEIRGGKLRAFVNAENVNPASKALQGVTVTAYDDKGQRSFLMVAKELTFENEAEWRVRGGATVLSPDFSSVARTDEVWPQQMPRLTGDFTKAVSSGPPDFDAKSMGQMAETIAQAKAKGDMTRGQIANYEYGYWNKLAVPLAAVIFGTLGAVLGIRNHRTGTAAGFALAVAIIFGYVTLANFMSVWAMGGALPAYAASFAPLVVGLACSAVIMWRRNG